MSRMLLPLILLGFKKLRNMFLILPLHFAVNEKHATYRFLALTFEQSHARTSADTS